MATTRITAIEIHDAKLFAPSGIVYNWARKITTEVKVAAQSKAPPSRSKAKWGTKATGELQRGIKGRVDKAGPKVLDMVIESTAPHTKYVHGGTAYQGQRYIYSTLGWANKAFVDEVLASGEVAVGEEFKGLFMRLPPPGPRFLMRVRGQKRNPFLTDGYNEVAKVHRALKPVRVKFKF